MGKKENKKLFVIPHYFKENKNSPYGSGRETAAHRLNVLSTTISTLHENFGESSKIVVCTDNKNHLIEKLPKKIKKLFTHEIRNPKNPMYLGFECQDILSENIKEYDYFCYLEDDLIIRDKLFFNKLKLFNDVFGNSFLLQPNRFEYSSKYFEKYYIDKIISNWNEGSITLEYQNKKINFINSQNPHSGCFFLNKTQMNKITVSKTFRKRTSNFVGPLESAASYSIMKSFIIYKPSLLNRNWLEVQHPGKRYLNEYVVNPGGSMSSFCNRLKRISILKLFWRLLIKISKFFG